MFQDIAPYSFCNDFAWIEPEATDRVLLYQGFRVLVSIDPCDCDGEEEGSKPVLRFPTYEQLSTAGIVGKLVAQGSLLKADETQPRAYFLFTVGETAYFRCEADSEALDAFAATPSNPWQLLPVSELKSYVPKHRAFAGLVGYEYDTWYASRRFCGKCGTPLVHDMVERMVRCPKCGTMEFPKLFPAVIVGIVDKERDKVLVSRYANREFKRYALIAGFCEMGETVEETVKREVMEEVGLKVKNLRYYKSQPWPPSSSLLFGFFCELDGSNRIELDDHELECAEWVDRSQLPQDEDYSLTYEMMQVLREGRESSC